MARPGPEELIVGTIIEDLYDHEGFGARRLPDGSLSGVWSRETAHFDAYLAACGCGWQGGHAHPPTEAGYESAVYEWERAHARPLLAEAVPPGVKSAIRDARQAIGRLARDPPAGARRARRVDGRDSPAVGRPGLQRA